MFANGLAGCNGEHSALDGLPVGRLADFIITFQHAPLPQPAAAFHPPHHINFDTNQALEVRLQHSSVLFKKFISTFSFRVLRFDAFGSEIIKKWGVSPDAVVQFALQLTYHKIHGMSLVVLQSLSFGGHFAPITQSEKSENANHRTRVVCSRRLLDQI